MLFRSAVTALRLHHHLRLALLARGGRGKAIVDLDRLFLFRRADHLRADSQRHQQKGEKGEKFALHHQKLRIMLARRSEEHTSELQSLMRNSYAVFCLKKKTKQYDIETNRH